tara:strand:- start:13305 stop:14063 length:759 start_codon:yes stop_codon:yes gene_type:complete
MIYFNGCSYTYGIGTGKHDNLETCSKYCYPTIISQLLDKEIINEAEPASCNFNIYRKFIKYISAGNSPELVVIMWSDALRSEVFKPGLWDNSHFDNGINQITPQNTNNIKDYYLREAMEGYYGFIANESKGALDTLTLMAGVQSICEAKNIPVIQMQYKSNLERYVRHANMLDTNDRDNKLLLENINYYVKYFDERDHVHGYKEADMRSFETIRKENHLPNSLYSLGHPGREAHEFMGKYLSDYLKENDIIS